MQDHGGIRAEGGEGDGRVTVEGFPLGPFETNCYIVSVGDAPGCWIIDAGFQPRAIIDRVRERGLEPEAIILTHAHLDHIAGLPELRETFGVPVIMHRDEAHWLSDPDLNLSNGFGMPFTTDPPDRTLGDADQLTLGATTWDVLHTPGHSPGSVSLHNAESGIVLAGDTLFRDSVGRFDFPTSDGDALFRSIREKLYTLANETVVLPGHGPETTVGYEKAKNPFVKGVGR